MSRDATVLFGALEVLAARRQCHHPGEGHEDIPRVRKEMLMHRREQMNTMYPLFAEHAFEAICTLGVARTLCIENNEGPFLLVRSNLF